MWRKRALENEKIDPFVEILNQDVDKEPMTFSSLLKSYDTRWTEMIELTKMDRDRILKLSSSSTKEIMLSQFDAEQEREVEQEQMEEAEEEEQVRVEKLISRRNGKTIVWKIKTLQEQCVKLPIMKSCLPKNLFVTKNWSNDCDSIMKSVHTFVLLDNKRVVVMTLAEAETLRRMHHLGLVDINVKMMVGNHHVMDLHQRAMLRFLNSELYYDKDEIRVLTTFGDTTQRREFFEYCLRKRPSRDQRVWLDTPVETVLRSADEERGHLWLNSLRIELKGRLYRGSDKINALGLSRFLGMSDVRDAKRVIKLLKGSEDALLSREDICHAFGMKGMEKNEEEEIDTIMWECHVCTFLNRLEDYYCEMCQNVRGTK